MPTPPPDWRAGLAGDEAARRLAAEGPNALPGSERQPLWAIVGAVVGEPMFLMLLAAGAVYLALGDRAEAAFLLGFVFVVIGITLAQERRTRRALEALRDLSAPRALVLRGGAEQRIPGREVVRGDVLVLHEGDRVAADALLFEGQLTLDESLLTGESVPVAKASAGAGAFSRALDVPGAEGSASVFAGTVVTRGVGLALVKATGAATATGRIGGALAATREPPSGLQRASRALVRRLTIAGLALAAALVLLLAWRGGRPLLESLLAGIALAMAILPEEIPVILTVFLALGAWRMSHRQVLTRRIAAVEALGAITVLAVDKTGTLTMNRMTVAELRTPDGAAFAGNAAGPLPEAFHTLAEFAVLATPADPFDPMEKAIQAFGRERLQGTGHLHPDNAPEFRFDLSPEIVAMTLVYPEGEPSRHLLATKGAPEAVADLCHLPEAGREAVRREVAAMAGRGLRVLGVARGRWAGSTLPVSHHEPDFEFLGLLGLHDPPRPEVPAALAECRGAGVRVVMMTGDHPQTAAAIARQVGLGDSPEVLTGAELAALDDEALRVRLREVSICARLQPEHKLRLVRALQADRQVVAMTGDGVNDAPALKAADVGVAMGGRGTDVAREAAALVLLDDSFASIVAAVRQGRRIHDNIARAARFVFAVHLPVIALALVPALLQWPALLLPLHIVLLELLIDPACSIVFEAEPEAPDLMTRPPRAPEASPFDAANIADGLAQGAGVAVALLGGQALLLWQGAAADAVRLAVFGALLLALLLLVQANRERHAGANRWVPRLAAAVGLLLALATTLPALRELLQLQWSGPVQLAAAAAMLLPAAAWLFALRVWRRRRGPGGRHDGGRVGGGVASSG
jgi:Ca2+-transporting ATPase